MSGVNNLSTSGNSYSVVGRCFTYICKVLLVVLQNYCPPAGPGRSLGIKNSEELYPLIMGIQYPFSEKW